MIKEDDEEEDQTAPAIEEVSKTPPKEIIVDEDEDEIDDNIRSGVDTLLANELRRTENNDLYKELQKEIKKKNQYAIRAGSKCKTKKY
jgi:hypothetical protein